MKCSSWFGKSERVRVCERQRLDDESEKFEFCGSICQY